MDEKEQRNNRLEEYRRDGLEEKAMLATHAMVGGIVIFVAGVAAFLASASLESATRFRFPSLVSMGLGFVVFLLARFFVLKQIKSTARRIAKRNNPDYFSDDK